MALSDNIDGTAGTVCPRCRIVIKKGRGIEQDSTGTWRHRACLEIVTRTKLPHRTNKHAQLYLVKGSKIITIKPASTPTPDRQE